MTTSRLKHFPISFFSIIMGLSGFIIAMQKFEIIYKTFKLSHPLGYIDLTLFLIILLTYVLKFIKYNDEVKGDFNHPIRMAFVPTISISMLLLSIAFLEIDASISKTLFFIGAPLHLFFSLNTITKWVQHTNFQIQHFNPAWFIPILGNLLVPIAGTKFISKEILWFFFSIGIAFYLPFLTMLLYRIIFHNNLPEKLMPTLFILIAPPSVGLIAYFKLTEGIDNFARILYYFALFTLLLVFSQYKMFTKIKFYLSWWAYIFPLSAFSVATFVMLNNTKLIFFKTLFTAIFLLIILLVVIISYKTIYAISKKQICIEEE
ncbi:SLAC1 anion channel family protein [Caloramator australicus]|uniref:C4-dicarboxylate transporter/malic acid transport protein n=1 Tax=Caloramator australicus RC3 TaxID=857293 RepID=I7J5T4_9CLOT|nr:SLAC1 anion channel family protein [Caloramator australicus]CCJ34002.1 C4-dicarboxylate transporter/malic acid transport protein [Caloramator australicus RC3]